MKTDHIGASVLEVCFSLAIGMPAIAIGLGVAVCILRLFRIM